MNNSVTTWISTQEKVEKKPEKGSLNRTIRKILKKHYG